MTFNDGAAGTVTSATATSLIVTFLTDPTAAGSLTAVVAVSGDGNSGFPVQVANILGPPSVTPNTNDLPNNNSTITITGFGFSPTAANDSVSFNQGTVGTVTSATATSLIVTFSTGGSLLNAIVTVSGSGMSSSTQVATLTAPTIDTEITNLPANAANSVDIYGYFGDALSTATDFVTFNLGAVGTITTLYPSFMILAFTTEPTVAGDLIATVTIGGFGVASARLPRWFPWSPPVAPACWQLTPA